MQNAAINAERSNGNRFNQARGEGGVWGALHRWIAGENVAYKEKEGVEGRNNEKGDVPTLASYSASRSIEQLVRPLAPPSSPKGGLEQSQKEQKKHVIWVDERQHPG